MALLAAASLAACGERHADHTAKSSIDAAPAFKPIDGFNGLELGGSFEKLIGNLDTSLFYPGSIAECFPDLPLKGCRLLGPRENVYTMRDAIPYSLSLAFNRRGFLTDIGLHFRREGQIDDEQCRDIFGRTLDWVASDFGPLDFRNSKAPAKEPLVWAKSPKGVTYAYGAPSRDGSFVTKFMRVKSLRETTRKVGEEVRYYALNRNLNVFASFIMVDENPICSVDVTFAEPDAVERASWNNS